MPAPTASFRVGPVWSAWLKERTGSWWCLGRVGEGRFSGLLSLTEIKPVLRGDWDLTFPQLQPLLTQFTLPAYLEQPVAFSGRVGWREGQLAISAGQFQFGTASVTGNNRTCVGAIHSGNAPA